MDATHTTTDILTVTYGITSGGPGYGVVDSLDWSFADVKMMAREYADYVNGQHHWCASDYAQNVGIPETQVMQAV